MITMKEPSLTVYPTREQMLALIQARAAIGTAERGDERRSAGPEQEPLWPTCIFHIED